MWVSAPIEREERWVHAGVFRHLIDTLHPGRFHYSADAPAQVELVVWDQPQEKRFVVHLVNLQERLPVLPIYDLRVTIRLDGRQVRDARLAPGGEPLSCTQEDDQATVEVPKLPLYRMLLVSYTTRYRRNGALSVNQVAIYLVHTIRSVMFVNSCRWSDCCHCTGSKRTAIHLALQIRGFAVPK